MFIYVRQSRRAHGLMSRGLKAGRASKRPAEGSNTQSCIILCCFRRSRMVARPMTELKGLLWGEKICSRVWGSFIVVERQRKQNSCQLCIAIVKTAEQY